MGLVLQLVVSQTFENLYTSVHVYVLSALRRCPGALWEDWFSDGASAGARRGEKNTHTDRKKPNDDL